MRRPADVYQSSGRQYPSSLPEPTYPPYDDTLYVSPNGYLRIPGRPSFFLTRSLANPSESGKAKTAAGSSLSSARTPVISRKTAPKPYSGLPSQAPEMCNPCARSKTLPMCEVAPETSGRAGRIA